MQRDLYLYVDDHMISEGKITLHEIQYHLVQWVATYQWTTVVPAKSDREVLFYLQLLCKK